RLKKRFAMLDIHTIRDLRDADPALIRKKFSVVLQRTVYELRGIDCVPDDVEHKAKEQLIFSRMLGKPTETVDEMEQVISVYAQRAAYRLRKQRSVAKHLQVFASTSAYGSGPFSAPSVAVTLTAPTDDPITLTKAAIAALRPNIEPGLKYNRAGVILTGISPKESHQYLEPFVGQYEHRNLAEAIDRVNRRHGDRAVGLGLAGLKSGPVWQMRRGNLSRRATTHWDELAVVKAG
uniref:DinB/UmuC family translesion DNA polymerase n=1 Tax=Agromyces humi TaxID=1766800 RepID=UPI0019399199